MVPREKTALVNFAVKPVVFSFITVSIYLDEIHGNSTPFTLL